MTIDTLEVVLNSVYPTKYHSFTTKQLENTPPPYITFLVPNGTPITANSKIISEINSFQVELYTLKINRTAEKKLEKAFADNKIVYSNKSRLYIQEESIHQTVYEFEMEEKI